MGRIPNLDSLLEVTVTSLHVPTHNGAQHKVYTKKGTSNIKTLNLIVEYAFQLEAYI